MSSLNFYFNIIAPNKVWPYYIINYNYLFYSYEDMLNLSSKLAHSSGSSYLQDTQYTYIPLSVAKSINLFIVA